MEEAVNSSSQRGSSKSSSWHGLSHDSVALRAISSGSFAIGGEGIGLGDEDLLLEANLIVIIE